MPPARKGERVRYPARFVPDGVRHYVSDTGHAGDPDGWNAGGKWVVGLAGNQQVARDVEVLTADAIERLKDVPVVGDGQLVQHRGRDQPGVSDRSVLLALGPILTKIWMRVDYAAELVDVLNSVAPEEPVLVAEVVVDASEKLTIIDGVAALAAEVHLPVEYRRAEVRSRPELKKALRLRRDPAGGNLITGKRLPA